MSEQVPQKESSFPAQQKLNVYCGDEIDLRELFKALLEGKFIFLITTALFAIGSAVYAFSQPNIYQVEASFVLNKDIYGIEKAEYPVLSSSILTGNQIKRVIASKIEDTESLLSGISITFDKREHLITVSRRSTSPSEALKSVELIYLNLNSILKQEVLADVSLAVDSALSLESVLVSGKVQESLSEIYALQLYKKAVLENPSSELIKVVSPPVKPTSYVKPKRPLIIVLGVLLGGMLGIAIVLIRFTFRKEED